MMNMGEVKLIGADKSVFCARIEWALKLKGVDYEYLEEDLKNKSQTLLKYNPVHKKVPVLLHHDKPIAESLVILEYIDDTWTSGTPLLPLDPLQKANARFWAKFSDEKVLLGSFRAAFMAPGEEKEKAIESARENLAFLEKELTGKKFFAGENVGYLDLVIGWVPLWLEALEEVGEMKLIGADRFPCLHDWSANFTDIPSIKECLPSRESLVAYGKATIGYLRSLEAKKP